MSTTMTIRLDDAMKDRLDALAKAMARSKSYLAVNAIEEYITANEWQIQQIKEAVAAADSPDAEFVDHENVKNWLNTWGNADEKDAPRCT